MDEKKTYPTGTVTITTEEYRDLITDCIESKKDLSKYISEYWTEKNAKAAVQAELDETKKRLETVMAFVLENKERAAAYGIFCAEMRGKDNA